MAMNEKAESVGVPPCAVFIVKPDPLLDETEAMISFEVSLQLATITGVVPLLKLFE